MDEDIYQLPDGRTVGFPKGMSQDKVLGILKSNGLMSEEPRFKEPVYNSQPSQPSLASQYEAPGRESFEDRFGGAIQGPEEAPPEVDRFAGSFSRNPGIFDRTIGAFQEQFVGGAKSVVPSALATYASVTGDEQDFDTHMQRILEIKGDAAYYNPDPPSLAEVRAKWDRNGVGSAVAEMFDLTASALGGSVGFMIPAIAGASVAAAVAPFSGPAAITMLGFGGMASWSQNYGNILGRSYEAAGEDPDIEDINIPTQMLAAAGVTALDMVAPGTVGFLTKPLKAVASTGLAKKAASAAVTSFGARATVKAMSPIAQRASNAASYKVTQDVLKKAYGSYAGRVALAAAAESSTEVAQSVIERAAAGLEISSSDQAAFDEYIEVAVAAGLLGAGFGSVSKYTEGSQSRADAEALKFTADRAVRSVITDLDPNIDISEQIQNPNIVSAQPDVGETIKPQTKSKVAFDGSKRIYRDADDRNWFITRDSAGKAVGINSSLKEANKWRDSRLATDPDLGLQDVSLERGFAVRSEQKKNGRVALSVPTGFITKEQGDIQADQEVIRQRESTKSPKELANDRTKAAPSPLKLFPRPESWESARKRINPTSTARQPYNGVKVKTGKMRLPNIPSIGMRSTDIIIPAGEYDAKTGKGFGMEKIKADFEPTGKFKTFQQSAADFINEMSKSGKKFADRKDIEHVAAKGGRQNIFVWTPTGQKAPLTMVFESFVDQNGKSKAVLTEMFTGTDYSSRVGSSGMGPGVSTTALVAAHGTGATEASVAKGKTNIRRASKNVKYKDNSNRTFNRFEKYASDLLTRFTGKESTPNDSFRGKMLDEFDPIAKSEKNTVDAKTGRRLRADEGADSAARDLSASVRWGGVEAGHRGFYEFVPTSEDGVNGTINVTDFEFDTQTRPIIHLADTAARKAPLAKAGDPKSRLSEPSKVTTKVFESDLLEGVETGGPITILTALDKKYPGKGIDMFQQYRRAVQSYRIEKQNKALVAQGRFDEVTPSGQTELEIRQGLALGSNPDIAVAFHNWQLLNDKRIQFLVDTQTISPELGIKWAENSDYISSQIDIENTQDYFLENQIERELAAIGEWPKVFNSAGQRNVSKKFTGIKSDMAKFVDPTKADFDNSVRFAAAGTRNVLTLRALRDMTASASARPWVDGMVGTPVKVFEEGVLKKYQVDDEHMLKALTTSGDVDLAAIMRDTQLFGVPIGKAITPFATWLREGVTREPGFGIANTGRDGGQSGIIHGTGLLTPIRSLNRAVRQMTKRPDAVSKSRGMLARKGIIQGVDSVGASRSRALAGDQVVAGIYEANRPTQRGFAKSVIKKGWDGLEQFATSSESATREIVYEKVYPVILQQALDDGHADHVAHNMANAEASYQSREVLNFDRHGSAQAIQIITSLTPFVNSMMQGMDVLFRAGLNNRPAGALEGDPGTFQKTVMTRIAYLMAASAALELLSYGDEDYENLSEYQRTNNFFIPGLGIKLPIPFQLGLLIKGPGRLMRSLMLAYEGDASRGGREMGSYLWEFAGQATFLTGNFTVIPTFAKPVFESWTNRSMLTGGPLRATYEEDRPPIEREAGSTSYIGKLIAKTMNAVPGIPGEASPKDIDNAWRAYTGLLGVGVWNSTDTAVRWGAYQTGADKLIGVPNPMKPSPMAKDMMVLSRFMIDHNKSGMTGEMYELSRELRGYHDAVNAALDPDAREAKEDKYEKYLESYEMMKPLLKEMAGLNKEANEIKQDLEMSSGDKSRELNEIYREQREIVTDYIELRKDMPL